MPKRSVADKAQARERQGTGGPAAVDGLDGLTSKHLLRTASAGEHCRYVACYHGARCACARGARPGSHRGLLDELPHVVEDLTPSPPRRATARQPPSAV